MGRRRGSRRRREHQAPDPANSRAERRRIKAEAKAQKRQHRERQRELDEAFGNHQEEEEVDNRAYLITTIREWVDADYYKREPSEGIWI